MTDARRIAVVTSSRADYSHLYWPLRAMAEHPRLAPRLLVLGAHLSPEFGRTVESIEADGFAVAERIECLLSSDSDTAMAKTIGLATLGLADALARERPELLLVIADRYEMLAPATVALALRIPIAHIEGGEISEGAIDDAVRNALTKMSHVHFTPTEQARRRVLALGEEAWRVHRVGAPSLDHIARANLPDLPALEKELQLAPGAPRIIAAFHPVTLHADTNDELEAFLAALGALPGQKLLCYPNADAGSRALLARLQAFCAGHEQRRLFVNLDAPRYLALLGSAQLFIGNSSSGIMETPSFALPTVNVGERQRGRERADNVLDAPARTEAILASAGRALDPGFRASLAGMQNPYGDGRAGERIAAVLAELPSGEELLAKRARPLNADGGWA
ncbi:MAG: UDP-N-acetylglucosamine 2-epimerase [Gammaproteobacteria bacterium]|nr:UDP-N-acetylglucosamine 2-epimerase [Gammaproteobacteria bacterium]